jgi:hypothetical protein
MVAPKNSVLFSLFSFLRPESGRVDGRQEQQLELIRSTMLSCLTPEASEPSYLERKIRNAKDVQVLWYLRADLMATLASQSGEIDARAKMEHVTRLFQGSLPRSLKARPSSLGT